MQRLHRTAAAVALMIGAMTVGCGSGDSGPSCDKVGEHISTKLADLNLFENSTDKTAAAAHCESEKWSGEYKECLLRATNIDTFLDCAEIEIRDQRNRELEAAKNPPPVPTLELADVAPADQGYTIKLPPNTEQKFCGLGGCLHTYEINEDHAYMINVGLDENVTNLATAKHSAARIVIHPKTITGADQVGDAFLVTFGDDPIWSKFVYFVKDTEGYRYAYCRGPRTNQHAKVLASMCTALRTQ
jgi:hypothetical protein